MFFGGENTVGGGATSPYPFAGFRGAKETSVASYDGYLAIYTTESSSAVSEKVRITSVGKFGICTSAPPENLSVTSLTGNATVGIYETTTVATNISRLAFTTQAGNHLIRTEAAGTGTLRTLQVGTGPATGANVVGVNTIIHGGQSTGSGAGGTLLLQTSPAGGAGAGVNALATAVTIASTGFVGVGMAPGAKLDVASTAGGGNSGIRLIQQAENVAASSSYAPLDFLVPTTGIVGQFLATANNYNAFGTFNLSANSVALVCYPTSGDLFLAAGGSSGTLKLNAGGLTSANTWITISSAGLVTLLDAANFAFGTTTGTKIGTATTQKLAFYNATPIVQGASIADPTGGAIIDAEARTALIALISRIEALGLIATI